MRMSKAEVIKAATSMEPGAYMPSEPHLVIDGVYDRLSTELLAACDAGDIKAERAGLDSMGAPVFRIGTGTVTLSKSWGYIARHGEGVLLTSWAAGAVGFAQ